MRRSPTALVAGLLGFVLPLAFILMASFGDDAHIASPVESSGERIHIWRYFKNVFSVNRIGSVFVTSSFVFAACWSDYLFATTLGGARLRTSVVVFQEIFQGAVIPWGVLVAGALVLAAPCILITLALEVILRRRKYDYGI